MRDPNAPAELGKRLGIEGGRIINLADSDFHHAAEETPLSADFKDLSEQESKEQPALIIFTTGSTAEPKAVLLSQYGMLTSNLNQPKVTPNIRTNVACIGVPLFHCMALLSAFNSLANGRPIILLETFSTNHILEFVPQHSATSLTTVSTVHLKLIEDPRFEDTLAKTIVTLGSGGGALTAAQYLRIESAYDNAILLNGYAQSESGGILSVARREDSLERRTQTVGRIFPDKDVRIKDPTKGFVPQGEVGEVVVGNHGDLMLGYYGLPKEDQPFDEEGFLHTGDLGFIDEEGFLHLVGRIKDIIIKGGENISPFEIERALTEIPNVREAKVIGVPDPIYGENIESAVTCVDKAGFDESRIKAALKGKIGSFKIPMHIMRFDEFPLNANNKLDQRSLKLDMVRRLQRIHVKEELGNGIVLFETRIKNTDFLIAPVADI